MRKAVDKHAVVIMVILCTIWALQQIALKGAASEITTLAQVGIRAGIAALLVGMVMLFRGLPLLGSGGLWKPGVFVGILFALEFLFVADGLKFTSASHMAVFLYTAPLFASLGLHLTIPEERLAPAQWMGMLLAFLGILVMFLGGKQTGELNSLTYWGDFLGLLGGAAWGSTTVVVRKTRLSDAPPTQTLFFQLFGAFVILTLLSGSKGELVFDLSYRSGISLAFQGIVVCFVSYLAWFWLLTKYQASQLGVLTFMTPPIGVVLGVLILGDTLERHFVVGTLMTLLGVVSVTGYGWYRRFLGRKAIELCSE